MTHQSMRYLCSDPSITVDLGSLTREKRQQMSNNQDRADLNEHPRETAAQERGSDDVGSNRVDEKQVAGCSVSRFWHKRPWDGKAHGLPAGIETGFRVQCDTHTAYCTFSGSSGRQEMRTTKATVLSAPQVVREKVNSWSPSFLKQYHILLLFPITDPVTSHFLLKVNLLS